ncbi:hypothetical protein VAR608DRAFT_0321 [Variovorax sp. HW608]|nr:hypothetical protein VAR608DRAFT_0321 [Variovorax sp. HW608]
MERANKLSVDRTSSKQDLVTAVLALEPQTKAARLRDVLPVIEQKLAEGVRIADIARTLNDGGLELTGGTLKSYLSRYRKRSKVKAPLSHSDPVGSASRGEPTGPDPATPFDPTAECRREVGNRGTDPA